MRLWRERRAKPAEARMRASNSGVESKVGGGFWGSDGVAVEVLS